MIAKIGVVERFIIKATIPGKKDIKVNGVNALCASLNVLEVLAMAIHNPLTKKEYAIITTTANRMVIGSYMILIPS